MSDVILDVNDLRTYFYTRQGVYKAVDGLSYQLKRGKTLGIVGESGSGKSVSVMSLLGLIPQPPGRIMSGTAMYNDVDLLQLKGESLRKMRGHKIAMIFQDPMTSLNPYLKISTQLTEGIIAHEGISYEEALKRSIESMEQVGIPAARKRIHAYPHQFSGGMRQRVMIAMALVGRPDILIADEPTTALDVTIQAQILDLLKSLQVSHNMSLILITHDLGVVAGVCDDVIVMYAGKKVEEGSVDDIFYRAAHPYTVGLLKSIPRLDQKLEKLFTIDGLPPDPGKLKDVGCAFAPRCAFVQDLCHGDIPLRTVATHHRSLCIREGGV
jgi:oligopeptide transport system ATP-binding protein